MKLKDFVFTDTDYRVETFYCIKEYENEQELQQDRYLVEIVEEFGTSEESDLTYEAWIRKIDEGTSELLFGMLKKDISKQDFIKLVEQTIQNEY